MIISVVIPTYRRSMDLSRCLQALASQEYLPQEVLVVVRDSDEETHAFFQHNAYEHLPVRLVTVSVPGQVAALNTGLDAALGEVVAITDDDTAPHPDWLRRIKAHFMADPALGGIGGRDWQLDERGEREVVGRVQWFGRVVGNHHLGNGIAREVEIIKGANMSYRRLAITDIRFDNRLLGEGAQVHNDMGFSLAVKKSGWKIVYDPEVAVDHYPAQRHDQDTNLRGLFNAEGIRNSAYNGTLIMLSFLPPVRRVAFLIWALLVGTWGEPGPLQVPRLLARHDKNVWNRLRATYSGRLAALDAVARGRH